MHRRLAPFTPLSHTARGASYIIVHIHQPQQRLVVSTGQSRGLWRKDDTQQKAGFPLPQQYLQDVPLNAPTTHRRLESPSPLLTTHLHASRCSDLKGGCGE